MCNDKEETAVGKISPTLQGEYGATGRPGSPGITGVPVRYHSYQ